MNEAKGLLLPGLFHFLFVCASEATQLFSVGG